MKTLFLIAAACTVLLAACGKPEPAESVESLSANPDRLKKLSAQCKTDHAKVGDALCNRVSEATRRRFMGSGTPYTPTQPFAATPASSLKE
ncbi:hypothetical protein BURK2_01840 [Burkholderiales bacterium]|nr:hypothetical protein BURK2_01840 [Burkholderiales bacterium]